MNNNKKVLLTFKNIQSIESASLSIVENCINIKYGYNGIGKSSLSRAIDYKINSKNEEMNFLSPYSGETPNVEISKTFNECVTFDNDYIDDYLFVDDYNLIGQSYNIFFKSKSIIDKEKEINNMLEGLKESLNDEYLSKYVNEKNEIKANISFKENGDIKNNCSFAKGFKNGPNYIKKQIDNGLGSYSEIINSPNNIDFLEWFNKGNNYIINNKCPYCLSNLPNDFSFIQQTIHDLLKDNIYKNNKKSKETINKIALLSELDKKDSLTNINSLDNPLEGETYNKIIESIKTIFLETKKIDNLKNINAYSFFRGEEQDILNQLEENRLNNNYFEKLEEKMFSISAKKVNKSIDNLINAIKSISNILKQYHDELTQNIKEANEEINIFLKYAGIPYSFSIEPQDYEESRTVIYPISNKNNVQEVKKRLSFGETNSFSLALFGAYVKRKKCDLVILDDPISSFDENKKHAVMHYLFNKENGVLKDKTVIIFTHDMFPLLDMVKKNTIGRKEVFATLLTNKNNIITEKEIKKEDIINSINNEKNLINESTEDYIKMIHFRRYTELNNGTKNNSGYSIASSAIHLKGSPSDINNNNYDSNIIENGSKEIRKYIPNFNYKSFVSKYTIEKLLELYKKTQSKYEKIILLRPLLKKSNKNKIIQTFINEFYHIENMFLYSIVGIDNIPNYIITLCDELVKEFEKTI